MKRARALISLDTEDDSKGNALLWVFKTERAAHVFRSRLNALLWLSAERERCRAQKCDLFVWTLNLEYDLCNLFGYDDFPEVALRFGRSALISARWRGVEFRDLLRHVPISVAEWGELVGLKKLEARAFSGARRPSLTVLIRRCIRDAAITLRAAKFLTASYGQFDVQPKRTLAATAYAIWSQKFYHHTIGRTPRSVWDAAREAYHGGRTQAFAVGRFTQVRVIDAASMFPWAMIHGPLPVPWSPYRRVTPGAPMDPLGVYRVRVQSDLKVPVLPVRTPLGTTFPNGEWAAWYVGEEIHYFMMRGGVVNQVLDGYEFQATDRPFDDYVTTLFQKKQRARGGARLMYKTLLTALYGKFGQAGKHIEVMPIDEFQRLDRAPLLWYPWNGMAIFTVEESPPIWSNNVWPAFITARARIRLHEAMMRVRADGGRVLYTDTDSVMYQGGKPFPKHALKPGDFELRGSYREALIVGKKEYGLKPHGARRWEYHTKGVPSAQRQQYLATGRAQFERPTKIREGARRGLQPNVWRTVEKVRRTDLKTRSGADGTLPTPIVGEEIDSA